MLPLISADSKSFIDLGSGGGIPALPLAIAGSLSVILIESDHRKASFLREAARTTGIEAEIRAERAEKAAASPTSLVTARALAPLDTLLGYAEPLLLPGGSCLFLKGATAAAELVAAKQYWDMHVTITPSRTDPTGQILHISGISRA